MANNHEKDTKDKIEFYKIYVEEEHYFITEHQKRIEFFTGLLTAIITLTIYGLLKATFWWYQFVILMFGGILLMMASKIGKAGTQRFYQRFLEAVTTRAKIEQDLGFSNKRGDGEGKWVEIEPYSPVRHIKSREDQEFYTSKEWVNFHLDKKKNMKEKKNNYHRVSRNLFSVVFYVGIIFILIAFVLAYFSYVKCNVIPHLL